LVVTPDLRIYPCDAFKNIKAEDIVNDVEYSNLNDYSIIDCWTKSKYLTVIREAIQNKNACIKCKQFLKCKSGCMAQKYLFYGKIVDDKDPACLLGDSINDIQRR
jgi:radical SAM protein with 4Fe4S-binding SPASM domain